jgi:hypothetical protein
MRRSLDLDHWAAFQRSFGEMVVLLGELGRDRPHGGDRGRTITVLGGDVHTGLRGEVELARRPQRTRIHQVVCSPVPQPARVRCRRRSCRATTGLAPRRLVVRPFARLAGVQAPAARWRFVAGPTFDNSIAVLTLNELAADVMISRSGPEDGEGPVLTIAHMRVLSPG